MNTGEAVQLIKVKMGEEDTDLTTAKADYALKAAVAYFNILGEYRWNQSKVTGTLESGTAAYDVATLFPDKMVRTLFDEPIWLTDQKQQVVYLEPKSFNAEARGTSASGVPRIWTMYGTEPTIEFFPVPGGAYPIWARAGIYINSFEELPEELQMPAVILACCGVMKSNMPEYVATLKMWQEMEKKICNTKAWTSWRGNRMPGDEYAFSASSYAGYGADTYNPHGV